MITPQKSHRANRIPAAQGQRQSFTLVELLVVIAIIGILASFLMPALRKSLDSARMISCANQQKQLGLAIRSYTDSNNDYFPQQMMVVSGSSIFWTQNLVRNGYLGGTTLVGNDLPAVFGCPSRSTKPPRRDRPSYAMNLALSSWGGTFWTKRISTIQQQTRFFALVESDYSLTDGNDWGMFMVSRSQSSLFYTGHQQGGNQLYIDGHVNRIPYAQMLVYAAVYPQTGEPWEP